MTDVTAERWLSIPGYEGFYEVSDLGRVKSLDRLEPVSAAGRRPYVRHRRERILKPNPDRDGYRKVRLNRDGIAVEFKVHALVLLAFDRPCPEGMKCRHLNDIKDDNRLVNLAWGTDSENMLDLQRNGLNFNLNKDRCPQGHEYSIKTGSNGRPWRYCRTCHADQERERRRRAKLAA